MRRESEAGIRQVLGEIGVGSDADLAGLLAFAPNGGWERVVDAERHDEGVLVANARLVRLKVEDKRC